MRGSLLVAYRDSNLRNKMTQGFNNTRVESGCHHFAKLAIIVNNIRSMNCDEMILRLEVLNSDIVDLVETKKKENIRKITKPYLIFCLFKY